MPAAHDSIGAALTGNSVGPIVPPIPNTTAGVFALLVYGTRTNTAHTINSNDGSWTEIQETAQANFSYGVAYRRLTGGDADPSIAADATTGGNGIFGVVICATGILASGSPLDVAIATGTGSGTQSVAPTVTTATNGALVYTIQWMRDDFTGGSGFSNPVRSGGSPNLIFNDEDLSGSDASLGVTEEVIATAAAIGTTTLDWGASDTYDSITIALTPAASGAAAPTLMLMGIGT